MIINLLRNDFNRVYSVIKLWNDKVPDWAIVIYYILVLPIGLALLPFALIWSWYIIRKLTK